MLRDARTLALIAALALVACGDTAGTADTADTADTVATPDTTQAPGSDFEGTFAALQALLFEGQGCTTGACHGVEAAGGLDLTEGVAYAQLVDVTSDGSSLSRVYPGDRMRSYLYLKLLAATDSETAQIAGSPMPIGTPAIPDELLEALRLWIYAGAPETGTVIGTEALLG